MYVGGGTPAMKLNARAPCSHRQRFHGYWVILASKENFIQCGTRREEGREEKEEEENEISRCGVTAEDGEGGRQRSGVVGAKQQQQRRRQQEERGNLRRARCATHPPGDLPLPLTALSVFFPPPSPALSRSSPLSLLPSASWCISVMPGLFAATL